MNFWFVLTLLCAAQVWSKPNNRFVKEEDESYLEDDARESEDVGDAGVQDSYDDNESQGSSSGPVQVLTESKIFELAPGSTAFLPCRFQNAEHLTISWEKLNKAGNSTKLYMDTVKIATEDNHIELFGNNTLVIRNVGPNDEADYICAVQQYTKEDGKENKYVKHRIVLKGQQESVYLTITPGDYDDLNQGDNIQLSCEAHGQTPNSMSWARKGTRLISEKNVNRLQIFVSNATRKQAGEYACSAEIGKQTPLIKYVEVKVKHVPEIEYEKEGGHPRKEYYTSLGRETNISCIVHSHPPVRHFHWYKDDQELQIDGYRYNTSVHHISHHVLSIRNTTEDDLRQYHCRAKNDLGEARSPIISVTDTPGKPVFKDRQVLDGSVQLTWTVLSYQPIVESELLYRKNGTSEWRKNERVKHESRTDTEYTVFGIFENIEAEYYEAKLRTRNTGHKKNNWGPYSTSITFDGDYKKTAEATSEKGSSARAAISTLTMLLAVASLAYSPL